MKIKFLADVNIEKKIVDCLSRLGFDVKWIPDYNCEMKDDTLLDLANREKRILITNDKDFGELVFLRKKLSAGIILLRVKGQDTKEKVELIERLIQIHSDRLPNHFVLITQTRFQFIPMENIT